MKVKWLIEPEVFQKDEGPFIEALEVLNIEHAVCKFGTSYSQYIADFDKDACIVFHGSMQFARIIQAETRWKGLFHHLPKLECVYYYPYFGQELLNSDCVMLPLGELHRRKDWLFTHVANGNSLFVRPSNGYKSFAGMVLTKESWEKELRLLSYKGLNTELAVVAPTAIITKEWRTIVVDNKVVAGCQYKQEGKTVRIREVPDEVMTYAQKVAGKYRPEEAWTVDICETGNGDLKVLEVGSFSCCGFYVCDPVSIIQAINELFKFK